MPTEASSSTWSRVPADNQFFSWWPVDNAEHSYHATTRLDNGRQGLLVDPGAWSNLVGEQWIVDMAKKAIPAGLKPNQQRMTRPLTVQGVGSGSNRAEWEITMPIAVTETVNGDGVTKVFEYKAPTVGGPGKQLPALLGLQSMSRQSGVLEMKDGEEYLTFPGPGGYKVEWSPGTRRYKLECAPSGHLILQCDAYNQVTPGAGGLTTSTKEFFTDNATQPEQTHVAVPATTPSQSSTDPAPTTSTREHAEPAWKFVNKKKPKTTRRAEQVADVQKRYGLTQPPTTK